MSATRYAPTLTVQPILREGALSAEYSIVRSSATGDWVAVGSVREDDKPKLSPAWLLVGTGRSEDEAIEDLRQRLRAARLRASVM
jgi:hypothetical protein